MKSLILFVLCFSVAVFSTGLKVDLALAQSSNTETYNSSETTKPADLDLDSNAGNFTVRELFNAFESFANPEVFVALKKCCTNCSESGSCNTCNTPSKNPITGKLQCDALAVKATCDDNGDNCNKGGWD